MPKLQPLLSALASAVLTSASASAQGDTLFYTGFAGDLAGWTVEDLSSDATGDGWTWSDLPTGGRFTLPAIRSTSGPNGFALFDSDLQCSGSQNSRLRSPLLDLSAASEVEVRWQQLYRRFASSIFLEVSIDGGRTFGSVELAADLPEDAFLGAANGAPDRASVDLSSVAAGEDSVVLAFRYFSEPAIYGAAAGCGYAWMIDDVAVADAVAPPPAVDLDFVAVAPPAHFATPAGRGAELAWAAEVANRGAEAQTATVEVRVTPTGGEGELFTGATTSFSIAPGEVVAIPSLDAFPLPENPGDYTATYRIAGVERDASPAGNERQFRFLVTDSTYRKAPGLTTFARPRGDVSYSAGTVFALGGERTRLDSISFAVAVASAPATTGATLTLSTLAFVGDLDGDGALAAGTEVVELATRAIPVSELLLSDDVRVTVAPTQDDSPLTIDEEYDRLAVLITVPRSDSAASTQIDLGFYGEGGAYDFGYLERVGAGFAPSALSRSGDGELAIGVEAFGGLVPDISVTVGSVRSVNTIERPHGGVAYRLFPNPVDAHLAVEFDVAASRGEWRVELVDAVGRVWRAGRTGGGRLRWDTAQLPPGHYLVRASPEVGSGASIYASVLVQR